MGTTQYVDRPLHHDVTRAITDTKAHAQKTRITLLLIVCALARCAPEAPNLLPASCSDDSACGSLAVCIDGTCQDRNSVSCQSVVGGKPILQTSAQALYFELDHAQTATQSVEIRNIGDCLLTVFEAALAEGEQSAFDCPLCRHEYLERLETAQ